MLNKINNRLKLISQVANLLADGMTSKEIGAKLFLSPRTIEIYILQLKNETGAKNTANLVKILIQKGIINIEPEIV